MKREIAILRRLGPIPFWRGSVRCLAELGKIYERAGAVARSELMGCDADGFSARPSISDICLMAGYYTTLFGPCERKKLGLANNPPTGKENLVKYTS